MTDIDPNKVRGLSQSEAKQQIAWLQSNRDFMDAYTNKNVPAHSDSVEMMRLLHETAYPEQK